MAECDVDTLMDDAKCLQCLSDKQLAMLIVQLLCEINDVGVGGGTGGVLCGTEDPTEDPGVACAIYYRTDNYAMWKWHDGSGTWVQFIAA